MALGVGRSCASDALVGSIHSSDMVDARDVNDVSDELGFAIDGPEYGV